jgi:2'-5' RNA ligase
LLDEHALTRDHWWWRPGWSAGKSFYTWHLTFPDPAHAHTLVELFGPVLDRVPTMVAVEEDGLHVTIQGVGFTDAVTDTDLERIVESARNRLVRRKPFDIRIGPPVVDSETVQMPIQNPAGLAGIRDDLQLAIGDVWGSDNVPERGMQFRPHLTLAYSTGVSEVSELRSMLVAEKLDRTVAEERVGEISLIALNRDRSKYEWTSVAVVPLGIA